MKSVTINTTAAQLESLLNKRDTIRQQQMTRQMNGTRTAANLNASNWQVNDLNARIESLRADRKD